jgi:hypothetical protein
MPQAHDFLRSECLNQSFVSLFVLDASSIITSTTEQQARHLKAGQEAQVRVAVASRPTAADVAVRICGTARNGPVSHPARHLQQGALECRVSPHQVMYMYHHNHQGMTRACPDTTGPPNMCVNTGR